MLTRDSARTASRSELRESPRSAARSASRGSRSPARSAPEVIMALIFSMASSVTATVRAPSLRKDPMFVRVWHTAKGAKNGDAVRIVDAHHHLWDLRVRDQDWITGPALAPLRRNFLLGDYRPLARASGVAASVVVQTVTVPGETPELLALAAASDLIAGVVGWTDLTAPGVADRLAALAEMP